MERKPARKAPAGVCVIEAPCKINLHLWVGEKRPDGFHALESIFASLALSDTLKFECAGKEGGCELALNWELPAHEHPEKPIPPEKNLVFRAVSLFRERTGYKNGLFIRLDKRIPLGAGLGGGSSDAASSLLALNFLAGAPLSEKELGAMAVSLGSDVPFFLSGGAAFVSGRGEYIEPVKTPQGLWVVLVKPPFSSDTTVAFRLLDEARRHGTGEKKEKKSPQNPLFGEMLSKQRLICALEEDPETWPFGNDFLQLFLDSGFTGEERAAAAYRAILELLRKKGASFTGLSGSGSCCFGVFPAQKMAKIAEKELSMQGFYATFTFFLAPRALRY